MNVTDVLGPVRNRFRTYPRYVQRFGNMYGFAEYVIAMYCQVNIDLLIMKELRQEVVKRELREDAVKY